MFIIITIYLFIQSNQSYSDSRHVKYIISIKCNNIIIQQTIVKKHSYNQPAL